MKTHWLIVIFTTLAVFARVPAVAADNEAPDPIVLEQERLIKEDAERQAQTICDGIFGKDRSSVLVNVELGLQTSKKGGTAMNRKMDSESGIGDENFILPWVPAPKSVTKEEVPKDASVETSGAEQAQIDVKTVVGRFDITVVHDDEIPDARIEMARTTLESAFSRYRNVLKILFQPSKFIHEPAFDAKETVTKNLLDSINLKNIILLFLLFLAFYLLKFFFGPLAEFMKEYLQRMREQAKSRVEMENKSETDNQTEEQAETDENLGGQDGELTPEELAQLEAQEAEMEEKFEPFNYINDDNVKQAAYLLHHEEPWIVALVISYLTSDHAYKVMEALPPDLQAKVALETAMYRQTTMDQVRAINEDIRQKIDFVVGGLEKLVAILESSDRFARDNILEYLKNEKPGLYEKVRERILLFDDVVNFPKMAMQVLARELKTEDVGRALRGASPELQQKFYESMSQGAVTLLKEELEYGRPATPDQIEESRRKIVDLIKKMEGEGTISFRKRGAASALSGDEIAEAAGPLGLSGILAGAGGPTDPVESYNGANQAFEEGRYDDAIAGYEAAVAADETFAAAYQGLGTAYYQLERYQEALAAYERVLALEPNDELQAWVEQLRVSLSAAA